MDGYKYKQYTDEQKARIARSKKRQQKVWHCTYAFQIGFVGQMSKTQFIEGVHCLTGDSKNFIRTRTTETQNLQDIAIAEKQPGQVVKITS